MKITGPILIVDDDDDDHLLLQEIFESLGVSKHSIFFHTGYELLEYMKANVQPFLILSDINMPPIDGLKLRELICSDPRLKKMSIPYIFFSTAAAPTQVKQAYELTVQGFFLKAKTFDETQKRIKLILEYWSECRVPSDEDYAMA